MAPTEKPPCWFCGSPDVVDAAGPGCLYCRACKGVWCPPAAPTEDAPPPDPMPRHAGAYGPCPLCRAKGLSAAEHDAALDAYDHAEELAERDARIAALEAENARLREEMARTRDAHDVDSRALFEACARIATLTRERDAALARALTPEQAACVREMTDTLDASDVGVRARSLGLDRIGKG